MGVKLPRSYFSGEDVVGIARDLLGKSVYSLADNMLTGGIIVETEAYRGPEDRGSHAWNNKRTPRNEMMYAAGGVAYMYICYGIHDMLNVVTGAENSSHAILIRALQPTTGIGWMEERRGTADLLRLCKGPGALAKALGLSKVHNGCQLDGETLWIEDAETIPDSQVASSARIGLSFDGPFREIPWRFYVRGNRFVSATKT